MEKNTTERVSLFGMLSGVYATGAVCVLGALGHSLSLALLVRGYRAASVFEVLKALSACDIVFLIVMCLVQVRLHNHNYYMMVTGEYRLI